MSKVDDYPEPDFAEAANYWSLERLYLDLGDAKGRGLTPLEKKFLQGLLCGYSPAEIADRVYHGRSSSAVRVYLSNGLYKYLQELLIRQSGKTEKIKNWSRVTRLLDQAGYRKNTPDSFQQTQLSSEKAIIFPSTVADTPNYQDWEEKIEIPTFLGREKELYQLKHWIIQDKCRLIALLAMGGVGKTALVVKLVEQIQKNFDCIIWRSLRNALTPDVMIAGLIQSLSQSQGGSVISSDLSSLMAILRSRRCLLVFNQFESVFSVGKQAGVYRDGYEGYGEILRCLSQESHLSCCILTSREQPQELTLCQSSDLSVRSFYLGGLTTEAAQQLLIQQDLLATEEEQRELINICANNPLVIKIISLTIKEQFRRNITDFLANNTILISDIRQLLEQQFERLSNAEKQLMYNLAVSQRLREFQGINRNLLRDIHQKEQLNILTSLQRRSLILPNSSTFTQPLLLKAYILEKLVEQVEADRQDQTVALIVKLILREILLNE